MNSSIERLRRRSSAGALVLAAAVLYGSYYFERTHNVVFLTILAAVTFSAIASARKRWTAYLAAVLAGVWALSPTVVSPPQIIDPAIVDDRNLFTSRIGAGEQWRYTFTLRGLDRHRAECGTLTGTFFIDGDNLRQETVEVEVEGISAKPPEFVKSIGLDQIRIAADVGEEKTVSVRLRARPGHTPAMRIGPEVLGRKIYSDSVFFELTNPHCTVVYQTVRDVQPATEGG